MFKDEFGNNLDTHGKQLAAITTHWKTKYESSGPEPATVLAHMRSVLQADRRDGRAGPPLYGDS